MKKIIIFALCVLLICAMPIAVFAEDASVTETEVEESNTEEIVTYVKSHIEEISVIGTLLLAIFYEIRKHRSLNGTIGALNNNAITVAENSAEAIKNALSEAKDIAGVVSNYKEEFATLLAEIRKSAEEKARLEDTLNHVETFLLTAKSATLELSNEVAELLVLANIPNSKKEELYARHLKAVHDIEQVEEAISNDGEKT
jgi:hypothetical protein